jgi:cytoskeletal protein RodZ
MQNEIGAALKKARQQAGLSLEEMQDKTRIAQHDLAALEAGQFDRLPSPFYVRSYIRVYAAQVGLEPTKLLKKYRASLPPQSEETGHPAQDSKQQHHNLSRTGPFRPVSPTSGQESQNLNRTGRFRPVHANTQTAKHRALKQPQPKETKVNPLPALPVPSHHSEEPPTRSQTARNTKQQSDRQAAGVNSGTGRFRRTSPGPKPSDKTAAGSQSSLSRTQRFSSSSVGAASRQHHRPKEPRHNPARQEPPSRHSNPAGTFTDSASPKDGKRNNSNRSKKQRSWNKASLAVAAIALFILPGAVWAGYSWLGQPAEEPQKIQAQSHSSAGAESESSGLALVDRDTTSGISRYEMKNVRDTEVEIQAKDTCWVQIKEHQNGGYLKDITLKKGELFRFTHPKSVTTDLWITLGNPKNADIKINGQTITATQTIQVTKK